MAAVVCLLALPAAAQQGGDLTDEEVEDVIRLVRISGLSIKEIPDRSRTFAGLVAAQLLRGKFQQAMKEMKNVKTRLWQARTQIQIADYQQRKGRGKLFREALSKALKLVPTKQRPLGTDTTLREVAWRRAKMGDFADARRIIQRMGTRMGKIQSIFEIVELQKKNPDRKVVKGAAKSYSEIFKLAKGIDAEPVIKAALFVDIVKAQAAIQDSAGAEVTLNHLKAFLDKNKFDGRDDFVAELAGAYVLAGDLNTPMALVRSIGNEANRAMAMASVAGAVGRNGDIDSAVPLFDLAFGDAKILQKPKSRYKVLRHIAEQQTLIGLTADAFATAGWIRDREAQANALFGMAQGLIARNKYKDVILLAEFIPHIGMRAIMFSTAALVKGHAGDRMGASALLAQGLKDSGYKGEPVMLVEGLRRTIDVQSKVGAVEALESLVKRIEVLLGQLKDKLPKAGVMTQLARAQSRAGLSDAANSSLAVAWRLAWSNKEDPGFADSMAEIVTAQLLAGSILQAFDTAARVPDAAAAPKQTNTGLPGIVPDDIVETAKQKALRLVAVAAALLARPKLSIRAARQIKDTAARAKALADIAVAVAKAGPQS